MVAIQEVINASAQQVPEAPRVERNSFTRLISENQELFEKHSSLTYELRDEEKGWKSSPTLDAIVEMNVRLAFLLHPQRDRLSDKAVRKMKKQSETIIRNEVFGKPSEQPSAKASFLLHNSPTKLHLNPTPQIDALATAVGESVHDFRNSYFEFRAPLVSGIRESKAELMGKLEDFLLSDPSNIFAFRDFLSDKKNHGAEIEAIRPFLVSLAETEQGLAREKKEGIFHRVAKHWTDELKERPSPDTIDEFAPSIPPNAREWLEFAAQGETITSLLKRRSHVTDWPTELRDKFSSFVLSKYLGVLSSIEADLGQYKRSTPKSLLQRFDPILDTVIEKVVVNMPGKRTQSNEKRVSETVEKEKYPIGILKKGIESWEARVLTEEELSSRLQKDADSLAPSDIRMKTDLEKIIFSLREDPYGLGTEKITNRSIVIGHKALPLRSFNPGKRIGLYNDHPESHDIRIVYIIYENSGVPAIGLEGVYKHKEYMSKLKFAK